MILTHAVQWSFQNPRNDPPILEHYDPHTSWTIIMWIQTEQLSAHKLDNDPHTNCNTQGPYICKGPLDCDMSSSNVCITKMVNTMIVQFLSSEATLWFLSGVFLRQNILAETASRDLCAGRYLASLRQNLHHLTFLKDPILGIVSWAGF